MKTKDFKNKTEKELQALLTEKGLALRAFRFNVAGSNVRNVKEGRTLRRDIARIQTIFSSNKNSLKNTTKPAEKVSVKPVTKISAKAKIKTKSVKAKK
jgi:ribosomal protein L29